MKTGILLVCAFAICLSGCNEEKSYGLTEEGVLAFCRLQATTEILVIRLDKLEARIKELEARPYLDVDPDDNIMKVWSGPDPNEAKKPGRQINEKK